MLTECLKQVTKARSQPVLIEGDPGVGKTRLLHELEVQAEELGIKMLYGCANEFEQALPYAALASTLEGPLSSLPKDSLAQLGGASWEQLGALFPSVAPSRSDSIDARAHAHVVLANMLTSWAIEAPIVLAIDDAHWADQGTLEVVSLLARRLQDSRCLLVLAYRGRPPELTGRTAALFDQLARDPAAIKLEIETLDELDCSRLVSNLLEGKPDEDLKRLLFETTGGNPFFVEETVRSLEQSGALDEKEGRVTVADATVPVPPGASGLVYHRIFSLGAPAMTMARVASATGPIGLADAIYPAAIAATGLDETAAEEALDQLVRAGVLHHSDRDTLEFAHPIVRSLIYEDLGAVERRKIHRTLATELQAARRAGGAVTVLDIALHVAEAARVGDRDAVELLAAAGDETLERVPAIAATWYERAERLVPNSDSVTRAEIQTRRARALFLSDALTDTVEVARAAWSQLPEGRRAAAAGIVVAALTGLGRLDEAGEEVDRALEEAHARDESRGRLLAHRMSVLLYEGRVREAKGCGDESLELIGDDLAARVRVVRQLSQVAFVTGDLEQHRQLHSQALDLARTLPAGTTVSIQSYGGICLVGVGELGEARVMLEEAERLSELHGTLVYRPLIDMGLATLRRMEGRWGDALAHSMDVIEEAERSGRVDTMASWATLIAILSDRGEFGAARRYLSKLETEEAASNQLVWPYLMWCRAHFERLRGKAATAVDLLNQVVTVHDAQGLVIPAVGLLEMVESLLDAGRHGEAKLAAARLVELAEKIGTDYLHAVADYAELLVSGDADAGAHARRRFDELQMPFELAQTELALAAALHDADILTGTYHRFEKLGAEPWRRRAGAALRSMGQPVPRRSRKRQGQGLSDLEEQVTRLVAEGLSNREIASALSLSPRTVETYLSRIYTKTGCESRTELAVAVSARRLDQPNSEPR